MFMKQKLKARKKTTRIKKQPVPTTTRGIARSLVEKIAQYKTTIETRHIGAITRITDGVVKLQGLSDVAYLEMVEFPHGIKGVAVNLEENEVGTIVLGDYLKLKEGDVVKNTGKLLSVPVGDAFIGRVVDALGNPIDGKGSIKASDWYPVEKIAPGVVERQSVDVPIQTGIKAIDSMIPIGRGQRELIIGDRGVGKTALAIDTIINQKNEDVICIYVAIGQKASRIAQLIGSLEEHKALSHTIIVAANASDSVALQYIAPYSGVSLAEYFMSKGKDVLIVYDDLSKHAWAYRQVSLVLRRPSGREAYPGDIFYLHSRLLERACRLSKEYGGGSITALPIIETQAGDVSAYIPTNVISITDGQIYLEPDLFYAGQRPAVNVGLSVSRVGGAAQIKAMKQVASRLRLDLAQYRTLAAFVQFAQDLDEATKKQIDRGSRMVELLKQNQFVPMSVSEQVVLLWIGINGHIDMVPVTEIQRFEAEFLERLRNKHAKLLSIIQKEKAFSKESEAILKKAVEEFSAQFIKKITK